MSATNSICKLAQQIRFEVESDLRRRGILGPNDSVAIKAHFLSRKNGLHKTVRLDMAVDTFVHSKTSYYNRLLTKEELRSIRDDPCWPKQPLWIRNIVERIIDGGNECVMASELVQLVAESHYGNGSSKPPVLPCAVFQVNKALKEKEMPFRLTCPETRANPRSQERRYRFYAIVQ